VVVTIYKTAQIDRYPEVFAGAASLGVGTATAISLLLFMGACGKSAQLPLHAWLAAEAGADADVSDRLTSPDVLAGPAGDAVQSAHRGAGRAGGTGGE
jgi:hypothetical protein